MNNELHAAKIAGKATGALFFSGFGSLWMIAGLSLMRRLDAASLSAVLLVGSTLALAAGWVLKRAPKRSVDPNTIKRERQIGRRFGQINAIQWTAIAISVVLLNVFKQTDYIAPAVAIIVGLHLFPLGGLFRNPVHYITGAAMVLWSVGSMLSLSKQQVPFVDAIGAGVILLLSALYGIFSANSDLTQQQRNLDPA